MGVRVAGVGPAVRPGDKPLLPGLEKVYATEEVAPFRAADAV